GRVTRQRYGAAMAGDTSRVTRWKQRQDQLVATAAKMPKLRAVPRLVAGVDCAFSKADDLVFAAAIVWDRQAKQIVAEASARRELTVPYIPGYLSFREGPAVHAALDALGHAFGLVLFDGQGRAHPRRCGLAVHVGAERGVPSVGVAKSVLVGAFKEPGVSRGSTSPMTHRGEAVGQVVRTRDRVKPVYVSVGCGVGETLAVRAVLDCGNGFRLPEPTRQADRLVARVKAAAVRNRR
ncbi:MAG: endonuclease V, partial [Planctomycetota bacterium]